MKEDDEQITFVQWLELMDLRFSAIPNSTYTTSWKQKTRNRYLGLRAGLPDLLVLIPPNKSNDRRGHALFIEMKRKRGGVISPVQKQWISDLNELNSATIEAVVCRGADQAIEIVSQHLAPHLNRTVVI